MSTIPPVLTLNDARVAVHIVEIALDVESRADGYPHSQRMCSSEWASLLAHLKTLSAYVSKQAAKELEVESRKAPHCPECGAAGPHEDNGQTFASGDLSYCCSQCSTHFDYNVFTMTDKQRKEG